MNGFLALIVVALLLPLAEGTGAVVSCADAKSRCESRLEGPACVVLAREPRCTTTGWTLEPSVSQTQRAPPLSTAPGFTAALRPSWAARSRATLASLNSYFRRRTSFLTALVRMTTSAASLNCWKIMELSEPASLAETASTGGITTSAFQTSTSASRTLTSASRTSTSASRTSTSTSAFRTSTTATSTSALRTLTMGSVRHVETLCPSAYEKRRVLRKLHVTQAFASRPS